MIFDAFARRLRGSETWRREQEHVARLVVERPQDTLAFAAVLDLELDRRGFDPAVHAVRSSLLDLVCGLVHDDATQLAVRLASPPPMAAPATCDPQHRGGRAAMQIAGTRPASEIWELLAAPDGLRQHDPGFGTLLLHELVVRGQPAPAASGWYGDWAAETGHPLAQLPTELLAVELGLPRLLPRYGRAITAAGPRPSDPRLGEPRHLGAILPGVGDAVRVDRGRVGAAFRDWSEQASGKVDVSAYAAGAGFPPDLPAPRLSEGLRAARISPATGVEMLFSTAVAGGAYSRGPGGAHARLRTWETISGIVDRTWPAPVEQLAQAAGEAGWIRAEHDDPWFGGGLGHLWLVVEAAGRLVGVAATEAA